MKIEEQVLLSPFSTFRVGGPARYFITTHTVAETEQAIAFANAERLPIFVLGGGSNIVVADDGFNGVVIRPLLEHVSVKTNEDSALVTIGAGVDLDALIDRMVGEGYSGLEALSGIPGTVGGAVVANAGAYGAAIGDACESVNVLEIAKAHEGVKKMLPQQCKFSYHDSVFSQLSGRFLVLDVTLKLARGGEPDFSYKDNRFNFRDILDAEHLPHTCAGLRSAVLAIRKKKGVLKDSYKSAGSFFHMPYVTSAQYEEIKRIAKELDAEKEARLQPWAWEQTDGAYKLAPGFLLEYTPFQKGYVRGLVGISHKHTLSLINLGNAKASDVATLAHDMQRAVKEIFFVELEREVVYVGEVK